MVFHGPFVVFLGVGKTGCVPLAVGAREQRGAFPPLGHTVPLRKPAGRCSCRPGSFPFPFRVCPAYWGMWSPKEPGGRGRRFCGARPALPAPPCETRRRRPKAAGVTARFPRPPPPPPGRSEPWEERQALSFCQENNPLIQAQTCWKMFVSSCPFAASAWGVGVGMGSSGSISSMV